MEGSPLVKRFKTPQELLGDLDAGATAMLIEAAADVALVIDARGVIRDLAFGSEELSADWYERWRGQAWVDTVTVESRPKIVALLAEAAGVATPRWRHVNHPSPQGPDVPVLYSVVQVRREGRLVAFGRDLRATAALQKRLVDAQQSLERDYSRLRHLETRYRLLFEMTSEAVLVVDAATLKVVEANPAAGQLLGESERRLVGRSFTDGFDIASGPALQALLAGARATGRADGVRARLARIDRELLVAAFLFRHDSGALFLVRLVPGEHDPAIAALPKAKSKLLKLVESASDGFVITDSEGRILTANPAFVELIQLPTEEQAKDQSLERWFGRPGVDLNVLIANLRQHGSVRLFATTLRGEFGAMAEIEVSAVSLLNGEQPSFGFTIRNVGRRLTAEPRSGRELPRSVEQLTELVGRVPLKDLVRETTDVIERLCIEAALEITGDNRASAAEILGLSRQSLYVKLRRYGLGDLGTEAEE